jgi:hypothetical protein
MEFAANLSSCVACCGGWRILRSGFFLHPLGKGKPGRLCKSHPDKLKRQMAYYNY